MITCDLIGQTGNQMFQIATTMALALDNNDAFLIPEYSINRQEWPLHYKQLPKLSDQYRPELTEVYRDPDFSYNPIPYKPFIKLHGYFQSERYFAHRRQDVIHLFKREWPAEKFKIGLVAVHVRRGDYLRHPTKFISPSAEWITSAMAEMEKLITYRPKYLFFSDDIQWCKDNFPGHIYSEGRTPLQDMALMASCTHQIIGASTFGWWGAWMNENPNKYVIAPRTWFGPGNAHLNTKDIIPTTWIKM